MSQGKRIEATSPSVLSRRSALWEIGGGLGGIALGAMLGGDGLMADSSATGLT